MCLSHEINATSSVGHDTKFEKQGLQYLFLKRKLFIIVIIKAKSLKTISLDNGNIIRTILQFVLLCCSYFTLQYLKYVVGNSNFQ